MKLPARETPLIEQMEAIDPGRDLVMVAMDTLHDPADISAFIKEYVSSMFVHDFNENRQNEGLLRALWESRKEKISSTHTAVGYILTLALEHPDASNSWTAAVEKKYDFSRLSERTANLWR